MIQAMHRRAFTLVELLVVTVVVAVLLALLVTTSRKARARTSDINCVNVLKQVGCSFRLFGEDHDGRYPMSVYTNAALLPPASGRLLFFSVAISNELATPRALVCPTDRRTPASSWSTLTSSNISYFIGADATETQPQEALAGDRNLETNGVAVRPGLLRLTTNMNLGWTAEMHNRCGNLVMGDGSVQQTTSRRLQAILPTQVGETNELLVP